MHTLLGAYKNSATRRLLADFVNFIGMFQLPYPPWGIIFYFCLHRELFCIFYIKPKRILKKKKKKRYFVDIKPKRVFENNTFYEGSKGSIKALRFHGWRCHASRGPGFLLQLAEPWGRKEP